MTRLQPIEDREIKLNIRRDTREELTNALGNVRLTSWPELQLRLLAHKLSLLTSYENLESVETGQCQIRIMPHQVGAAFKVINEMGNRAILADEVGLGKTVEAGILIKEYLCRGLIESVLIFVPTTLLGQWKEEMQSKFGISFKTSQDKSLRYDADPFIITTFEKALKAERQEMLANREWGLVVIDEAHRRLRNPQTKTYKFVNRILKKYFLLLTATPLQTQVTDLWSLVHLVHPGLLGNQRMFHERFVADRSKHRLQNSGELGRILRRVMIRTRRTEAGVEFAYRFVFPKRIVLESAHPEYRIQDAILNWVHKEALQPDSHRSGRALQRTLLLREVASSVQAASTTLRNMLHTETKENTRKNLEELITELENYAQATPHPKLQALLSIQKEREDEKFLVFVQFRKTQAYLVEELNREGIKALAFAGNQRERGEKLSWFASVGKVLICCDKTGAEGLNLQEFCRVVVNYDLPWNPMTVEQRIGRVHRIGQNRDVHVFNLSITDTIEDSILEVLHERLNLFRVAVGAMDLVLGMGEFEGGVDVENKIAAAVMSESDRSSIRARLLREMDSRYLEEPKELQQQLMSFHEDVFKNFHLSALDDRYGSGQR